MHFWDCLAGVRSRFHRRRSRRWLSASFQKNIIPAVSGKVGAREDIKRLYHIAMARHFGLSSSVSYVRVLLEDYTSEEVVFESSPAYALVSAPTFRQMIEFVPDVKLLLMLRDPVDRLWSGTKYVYRSGKESGKFSESDILDKFRASCERPRSIAFRHSAYDKTFEEIEKAGAWDRFHVLFQETLSEPSEKQALKQCFGIEIELDQQKRVNVHAQHQDLPDELRVQAVEAFAPTYRAVRARFPDRVPTSWLA